MIQKDFQYTTEWGTFIEIENSLFGIAFVNNMMTGIVFSFKNTFTRHEIFSKFRSGKQT